MSLSWTYEDILGDECILICKDMHNTEPKNMERGAEKKNDQIAVSSIEESFNFDSRAKHK